MIEKVKLTAIFILTAKIKLVILNRSGKYYVLIFKKAYERRKRHCFNGFFRVP